MTTIWDLKQNPWDDAPRFYPPGQHPAYWRWRETLRKMEALGQGDHEAAGYIREQIAMFEQAESEAKAMYDRMLRDREED